MRTVLSLVLATLGVTLLLCVCLWYGYFAWGIVRSIYEAVRSARWWRNLWCSMIALRRFLAVQALAVGVIVFLLWRGNRAPIKLVFMVTALYLAVSSFAYYFACGIYGFFQESVNRSWLRRWISVNRRLLAKQAVALAAIVPVLLFTLGWEAGGQAALSIGVLVIAFPWAVAAKNVPK